MYEAERRMHSGGRKPHQFMVIEDCPLRSVTNGGLYVRDEGVSRHNRGVERQERLPQLVRALKRQALRA